MLEYQGIKIRWYGHDTFTFQKDNIICIDPYKLDRKIFADIILITHNHFDHLNEEDLMKVVNNSTTIIAAQECVSQLSKVNSKEVIGIMPGEEKTISGIKIRAVPAYNINKTNPDTGKQFHPKDDNKVGFIITIDGQSIYHTGDSDVIPEMQDLNPDVLLIPVSGTYVMTAKEAASAVEKIQPKIAIPMHYGTIVGSEADAKEFESLVNTCKVQILTKE